MTTVGSLHQKADQQDAIIKALTDSKAKAEQESASKSQFLANMR